MTYDEQLEAGKKYEDFVRDTLADKLGLFFHVFKSTQYQYNRGETTCGIEIKYNSQMTEYQSIWVEMWEKKTGSTQWIESGILRRDSSWLFLCGDYKQIFFLPKKTLQHLGEHRDIQVNNTNTSRGYTLSLADCDKYSINKIIIKE